MKCAVIIPVGPGHELLALDARESVEHAYRVAAGPFTALDVIAIDDSRGDLGRSTARNQGVAQAVRQGADWIFFLDADDVLAPRAFAAAGPHTRRYSAVWGAIAELAPDEESGVLRDGQVARLADFSQLLANDPWNTLQIGHFVKAEIAAAIPFDPKLDAGEDFDYYLRVWSRFDCIKIHEPLFYNRRGARSTGARSATDSQWRIAVQRLISDACATHKFYRDFSLHDESFRFYIENPFDNIQRHHLKGHFFAVEELDFLRTRIAPGAHILEVGANAGNHTVYYSRFMRPRKITVIEPNVEIVELLRRNLAVNRIDNADLSMLGTAVGGRDAHHRAIRVTPENPKGRRPESDADVDVKPVPLDSFNMEQVDLISIYVDAMAIEILQGATALINRWRPQIMVRVLEQQSSAFAEWLCRNAYRSVREFPSANAVTVMIEPMP